MAEVTGSGEPGRSGRGSRVVPYVAAWVLGALGCLVPWFAVREVPVEVNKWASIYVAGALGGFALEMLLGRGRLELPGPSFATAEEQETDERRPLGQLVDLGFLARIASSGLAAMAMLLVYHALVDETDTIEAFNELATDPSTFGWAVFLGASSPAIWTAAQKMVQSRIDAAMATNTAQIAVQQNTLNQKLQVLASAKQRLETAKAQAGRAPRGLASLRADLSGIIDEAASAQPGETDVDAVSERVLGLMQPVVPPGAVGVPAEAIDEALGIINAGLES